jgi:tRNA-dihydrouridine synthase A
MKAAVAIPVTVKCRLGVDEQDPEEALDRLADAVAAAGVDSLWVHARKAWLSGLSPKENRDVPPLDYGRVYRLKARWPRLFVGINGGIADMATARRHLAEVDGVMLGRAAYRTPAMLMEADRMLGEETPSPNLVSAAERMIPYLEAHCGAGGRAAAVTRHMIGLFQGRPGARAWRQILTEHAARHPTDTAVIRRALAAVSDAPLATAA